MEKRSQALLSLAKAKLSRRIAFWIFISIVVIEAIILVPSYFRREQELLDQVENVSAIQARFFLKSSMSMTTEQDLVALAQSVKQETNVVGWAVANEKNEVIAQKGEQLAIRAADLRGQDVIRVFNDRRDRYDVAWNGRALGSNYVLIIRHDVSFIKQELIAYVWRIIGLVAIISLFVTASTLVILGTIVILPILKLREDLELVADSVSCDSQEMAVLRFHSMLASRTDELGDVMGAFSQMYARIVKEIAERKLAEATIQKEKDTSEHLLLNILPLAMS